MLPRISFSKFKRRIQDLVSIIITVYPRCKSTEKARRFNGYLPVCMTWITNIQIIFVLGDILAYVKSELHSLIKVFRVITCVLQDWFRLSLTEEQMLVILFVYPVVEVYRDIRILLRLLNFPLQIKTMARWITNISHRSPKLGGVS